MRKVVVGVIGLLLLVLMAAPGFAQEEGSPIIEVVPRVERPLPPVGTPGTPGTLRDETQVLGTGTPLARTGFGAFEGLLLGAGLLVAGGGVVLVARRRSRVDL